MVNYKNLLINIEGVDGTGKTTVINQLLDKLKSTKIIVGNGKNVIPSIRTLDFPWYDSPTGEDIKKFLNGIYGDPSTKDPVVCANFYVKNRIEYFKMNPLSIGNADIIISNRSYFSNLGYQGVKLIDIDDLQQARDLMNDEIEKIIKFCYTQYYDEFISTGFDKLNLSYFNIFLYHPNINVNLERIAHRGNGARDKLESNIKYLNAINNLMLSLVSNEQWQEFVSRFPEYEFEPIQCSDSDGTSRSVEEMTDELYSIIETNYFLLNKLMFFR